MQKMMNLRESAPRYTKLLQGTVKYQGVPRTVVRSTGSTAKNYGITGIPSVVRSMGSNVALPNGI